MPDNQDDRRPRGRMPSIDPARARQIIAGPKPPPLTLPKNPRPAQF